MPKWLIGCVLLLVACKTSKPADAPRAAHRSEAAAPAPEAVPWLTQLDRDHPLVGRVWDAHDRAFIDAAALARRLAPAKFVLLGEQHDNPDHHRLQARLITELVSLGRRPAVVLEMLEVEQQPAIDAYRERGDATAAGFGAAVAWEKTSWPPFADYRPIFEAAFEGKLPILAGNIAQADAKALVKRGLSAIAPERAEQLRLHQPFPSELEAPLLDELRASHCGQLPESLLAPMALAQHARDAQIAQVSLSASGVDGAVVIAGAGHVRRDRGVPYYLGLATSEVSVASVVFREVRHDDDGSHASAPDPAPFDYVWYTPRHSDDDPCAGFHK